MRMRFGHLIALKALEYQHCPDHASVSWTAKRIGRYDPTAGECSVGDCTRLVPTLSDPRETCGPQIDSIPPVRLTTSAPRIKKLIFSPPNKCLIDLFGPVSNRSLLKKLLGAFSLKL
jgi:hypothetical protein